MNVVELVWWKHNCKAGQYRPAIVHGTLSVKPKSGVAVPQSADDYDINIAPLSGLKPEIYTDEPLG